MIVSKTCFKNWMIERAGILAENGNLPEKTADEMKTV